MLSNAIIRSDRILSALYIGLILSRCYTHIDKTLVVGDKIIGGISNELGEMFGGSLL